jgi:hypothetical protein
MSAIMAGDFGSNISKKGIILGVTTAERWAKKGGLNEQINPAKSPQLPY